MDLTGDPSPSGGEGSHGGGQGGSKAAKRVGPVVAMVAIAWLLKKLFGRRRV